MRIALLLTAFLFSAPISQAADWAELTKKVIEQGARHPLGETEELRHLDLVQPSDPSLPRTASFLTFRGYRTGEGGFYPISAGGVFEIWTLDAEDHWRIDQWLFIANVQNGKLRQAYHRLIREARDGSVLEIVDYPLPPREEQEALWANHLEKF